MVSSNDNVNAKYRRIFLQGITYRISSPRPVIPEHSNPGRVCHFSGAEVNVMTCYIHLI